MLLLFFYQKQKFCFTFFIFSKTIKLIAKKWVKKYLYDNDTKYYIENICHQFFDLSSHRRCSVGLQLHQKETPTQVFPVNIAKILRTPISKNICERLLLIVVIYCIKNWIKLFRNQICLLFHFETKKTLYFTYSHSISFVLSLAVIRFHSLSFFVTCCHSLSFLVLVVTRCTTRLFFINNRHRRYL